MQKLAEIAQTIWEDYMEPVGKVGLTLFGVSIGAKVAVWHVQLPDLPY